MRYVLVGDPKSCLSRWIVLSLFSFILVSLEIETCHSEVISPCFLSSIVYFCSGPVAEVLRFRYMNNLPQKSLSAQLPFLNNGIVLKICWEVGYKPCKRSFDMTSPTCCCYWELFLLLFWLISFGAKAESVLTFQWSVDLISNENQGQEFYWKWTSSFLHCLGFGVYNVILLCSSFPFCSLYWLILYVLHCIVKETNWLYVVSDLLTYWQNREKYFKLNRKMQLQNLNWPGLNGGKE